MSVQKNQVRFGYGDGRERVLAAVRMRDLITILFQKLPKHVGAESIMVDDKDKTTVGQKLIPSLHYLYACDCNAGTSAERKVQPSGDTTEPPVERLLKDRDDLRAEIRSPSVQRIVADDTESVDVVGQVTGAFYWWSAA